MFKPCGLRYQSLWLAIPTHVACASGISISCFQCLYLMLPYTMAHAATYTGTCFRIYWGKGLRPCKEPIGSCKDADASGKALRAGKAAKPRVRAVGRVRVFGVLGGLRSALWDEKR